MPAVSSIPITTRWTIRPSQAHRPLPSAEHRLAEIRATLPVDEKGLKERCASLAERERTALDQGDRVGAFEAHWALLHVRPEYYRREALEALRDQRVVAFRTEMNPSDVEVAHIEPGGRSWRVTNFCLDFGGPVGHRAGMALEQVADDLAHRWYRPSRAAAVAVEEAVRARASRVDV